MSKIAVNEITDEQGSGRPSFTNGVQTSNINGGQVGGRRNLIINGDMRVAQRGTSVSSASSDGYYTVDRWFIEITGGSANLEQSDDAPENFSNSLKLVVDSTYTPPGTQQNYIGTRLEGQNVRHLGYGTSNAKKSVLSFWAKSNDTRNRVLWLFNNNSTQFRHYAQVFSLSEVDTWEKFEFLIPADFYVPFDNNSGPGFQIRIILTSGYQGGIPDSGWVNISNSRHAGADNFYDTVGNEFYLTGVQLEVGDTATEFEHRLYGEELALCQRYYQKYVFNGSFPFSGRTLSGNRIDLNHPFRVRMRATPTLDSSEITGVRNAYFGTSKVSPDGSETFTLSGHGTVDIAGLRITGGGTYTQDQIANAQIDGAIAYDAEL